jgi:CBS domain-containing protein
MVERRFGALPVVDGGRTVGILTETDLLRRFAEESVAAPTKRQNAATARTGRRSPR